MKFSFWKKKKNCWVKDFGKQKRRDKEGKRM